MTDFRQLSDSIGIVAGIATFAAVGSSIVQLFQQVRRSRQVEQRVQNIEAQVEREPEKAHLVWDLARTKLEQYFDRNLAQVNAIFWVAVVVMLVGFCLVAYGVGAALQTPKELGPSIVGASAGIITEFIGATFMLIYRSTMQQAGSFMAVLERINTVGMAVQILDSIPEENDSLKNETRAELVKILLTGVEIRGGDKAMIPKPKARKAASGTP